MTNIVPKSVFIPTVGWVYFPRELVGKDLPTPAYQALWKRIVFDKTPKAPSKPPRS